MCPILLDCLDMEARKLSNLVPIANHPMQIPHRYQVDTIKSLSHIYCSVGYLYLGEMRHLY